MFVCGQCKRVVGPGISSTVRVPAWRDKVYPFRANAQRRLGLCRGQDVRAEELDEANLNAAPETRTCRDDHGGTGRERVSETHVCPSCVGPE